MGGNRVLVEADGFENKPKQRFPYIRHDFNHADIHHTDDSRSKKELSKPALENKPLS